MFNIIISLIKKWARYFIYAQSFIFLALPASTNYGLKSYGFEGGGGVGVSTNYSIEGGIGDVAGNNQTSANYKAGEGLLFLQQANTPAAPTLTNTSNWYNKLLLTLNVSNNPTDADFAVAISTDNFTTTNYLQDDNTIGATLGTEDWQTYAAWGGATGEYIVGLSPNTTYYVKIKARQGNFTETQWGPVASVATSQVSLTFDIDVSSADSETAAPYTVAFGQLAVGVVNTAANKVWLDFETNAEDGGYVYIYDQYGGLNSVSVNYTITSATADLASATEGFGIRNNSVTQTSGGPLAALSPYNVSSDNVGVVNTTIREIYNSTGSPIVGGRSSFLIKAKISSVTPASSDYTDTLTLISSVTF